MNLHELLGKLYVALIETQRNLDNVVEENNTLKAQLLSSVRVREQEAQTDDSAGTG